MVQQKAEVQNTFIYIISCGNAGRMPNLEKASLILTEVGKGCGTEHAATWIYSWCANLKI